ncbi:hypothetical protein CJF42_24210 [Pseudoalteromonas sp. NBT06-2]|uniref:hypothetical protein n=1 Tax=Pseudoalteromonas sp. NBT06-2 TaxID=2025950 RepID=UPI000BA70F57|nr:hypothetical protein [Pseudoalteromonas sp. NBT06-2]PAJ71894.1 hypothetical protein CJF42_24210 [Pseudoalteromonas sp. NBT06-2]
MKNLTQEIINEVVITANEAITFLNKRATTGFLIYAEDTLTNLVPFAQMAAKHSDEAKNVLDNLNKALDCVQTGKDVELLPEVKAA